MKLARLAYTPETVLDFHEAGLAALGAECARTWHDRLEVLAEGRAATLWNPDGSLHAGELHFVAADAPGGRDAARDVFPGCPLTFALAEALRASPPQRQNKRAIAPTSFRGTRSSCIRISMPCSSWPSPRGTPASTSSARMRPAR